MVPTDSPASAGRLMADLRGGNGRAADNLVEVFYPELRRLASAHMKQEQAGHTWQPTVLVNELYLELRRIKSLPPGTAADEEEKKAFFGLAAFLMKRLLIHHARPLAKRVEKIELGSEAEISGSGEQSLLEIENTLNRLAAIDPKLRLVVEMKVFEGLSRQEIATRLECSVRTVARQWEFAQHWLQEAMSSHERV